MAKAAKAEAKEAPKGEEGAPEGAAPAPAAKKSIVSRVLGPIFALPKLLKYLNPLVILKLPRMQQLMVVGGLLVVLGGGVAAYMFMPAGEEAHAEGEHGAEGAAHAEAAAEPVTALHLPAEHATFVDIPDLIVNIQSADGTPAYLKLVVALEIDQPEAGTLVEPVLPRVVDQFQTYLRELRVDDIRGSAGVMRLKEELLRRVNLALAPLPIRDVLFKEMIVQ